MGSLILSRSSICLGIKNSLVFSIQLVIEKLCHVIDI